MNLKQVVFTFSLVAVSGVASAQSPSPTPTPRGCRDQDINRIISRVDLRQRQVDHIDDRIGITEQNRDLQVEVINQNINNIKDGRSVVGSTLCKIVSFIQKCDNSKAIARLENRRERVKAQFAIRLERIRKLLVRAKARLDSEKKGLSDRYSRCGITPPVSPAPGNPVNLPDSPAAPQPPQNLPNIPQGGGGSGGGGSDNPGNNWNLT